MNRLREFCGRARRAGAGSQKGFGRDLPVGRVRVRAENKETERELQKREREKETKERET